jgi:hypothetical protein
MEDDIKALIMCAARPRSSPFERAQLINSIFSILVPCFLCLFIFVLHRYSFRHADTTDPGLSARMAHFDRKADEGEADEPEVDEMGRLPRAPPSEHGTVRPDGTVSYLNGTSRDPVMPSSQWHRLRATQAGWRSVTAPRAIREHPGRRLCPVPAPQRINASTMCHEATGRPSGRRGATTATMLPRRYDPDAPLRRVRPSTIKGRRHPISMSM